MKKYTYSAKQDDIPEKMVGGGAAEGMVLGRCQCRCVQVTGKHNPLFTRPMWIAVDFVVVINADKNYADRQKTAEEVLSIGYIGGLKEITAGKTSGKKTGRPGSLCGERHAAKKSSGPFNVR
ncbi:MAG: hypothetical protein R2875_09150 [Desulfobacterales bacterium]